MILLNLPHDMVADAMGWACSYWESGNYRAFKSIKDTADWFMDILFWD